MDNPIIKIHDGLLKGTISLNIDDEKFYSFLNIPYAQPPVEKLRFKAPVPVEPWEGIRDATKEGEQCIQKGDDYIMLIEKVESFTGSEDCLHLNVFTKKLPNQENKLKPVMVFIHGGGFIAGSSSEKLYSPVSLMTEDIVLVTINYRIGVLGFLSLKDSSFEIPGNAGLKDQTLALKWVQKNIHCFNGDPNNVTIFGESAGSVSVHYQILSISAKGLFQKAILQSGCALCPWACTNLDEIDYLKYLGISNTNDTYLTVKKLIELPIEQILEAQYKLCQEKKTFMLFGPVVENPNKSEFISKHPIDIIRLGEYNKVPMIFGYTSNEGLLDVYLKEVCKKQEIPYNDPTYDDFLPWSLDERKDVRKIAVEKMKALYENEENKGNPYLISADSLFLSGILAAVYNHIKVQKEPVYLYRMSIFTSCNYLSNYLKLDPKLGVVHGDDLGYIFNTSVFPKESPENIAIRRILKLWTNFANTGNPTTDLELGILWKPVEKDDLYFLDIGDELILGSNPEKERMQLWREIFQMHSLTESYLQ